MSSYVYVSILLFICMVVIGFYIRDNNTKIKKEFKSHIDNKQAESNKLNQAHFYSSFNRKDLERDYTCGCFYCLEIFNPKLKNGKAKGKTLHFVPIVVLIL